MMDIDNSGPQLRWATADDAIQIEKLLEPSILEGMKKLYSKKSILKLIESSSISVSIVGPDNTVEGLAVFDDYPHSIDFSNQDYKNAWEYAIGETFLTNFEHSPFNARWLVYFLLNAKYKEAEQKDILSKVMQVIYSSFPEQTGFIFYLPGDANPEDEKTLFDPIKELFIEIDRRKVQKQNNIHSSSKLLFSPRLHTQERLKIRMSKQEDHDDLTQVFYQQSEITSNTFGEYFVAELIASQDEKIKVIVAQAREKAVGLLAITNDVNLKVLHQHFELSSHDFLLKPEYMDALKKRREAIRKEKIEAEEAKRKQELEKLKDETMKCNRISQRIDLQEYCIKQQTKIMKEMEDLISNEEGAKKLKHDGAKKMFTEWLKGFTIEPPSSFFIDHETDDTELVCNIQTELEFFLSTLQMFGLPSGYMKGEGHFPDWGKKAQEEKNLKAKKKTILKKVKEKKEETAAKGKFGYKKGAADQEEKARPEHFDLEPMLKAFKKFINANAKTRSMLRTELKKKRATLDAMFVDDEGEATFKKCVDIITLGSKLMTQGFVFSPAQAEVIGNILLCFGEIATKERKKEMIVEEKTDEEDKEKDPVLLKIQKKEKAVKKDTAPKKIEVTLLETSIHDFLQAVEKITEYDYNQYKHKKLDYDLKDELEMDLKGSDKKEEEKKEGKEDIKKQENRKAEEDEIFGEEGDEEKPKQEEEQEKQEETKEAKEPTKKSEEAKDAKEQKKTEMKRTTTKAQQVTYKYSVDKEYEEIVSKVEDLESIPDAPAKAKNAIAVTLYCLENAFEARAGDFLKYAFDIYNDRSYLIVTMPHTVSETSLLRNFTQVPKKPHSNFSHTLYVLHRDTLQYEYMQVRRGKMDDIPQIKELMEFVPNKEEHEKLIQNAIDRKNNLDIFVAHRNDEVQAFFVITTDVNVPFYSSHFHIHEHLLLDQHERSGYTRLIITIINPIFQRHARTMIKEVMRLAGKTVMTLEIQNNTLIPTIFNEFLHISSRKFPRFLNKKWNHERYDNAVVKDFDKTQDGGDRDPLDEEEAKFTLSLLSKKMLVERKATCNARIVVVGASDCGISFIQSLLSYRYMSFTNIVLLAPGGFTYNYLKEPVKNLKSQSTNYTQSEIEKILLECHTRVVNARLVDIDREKKLAILHDGSAINYDYLIITAGLTDKTLQHLGYMTRSAMPIEGYLHMEGLISIDDPYLYQHFRPNGKISNLLFNKKKPQHVLIYGRSINCFCCIQGLLSRGMKPEYIHYAIPDETTYVTEGYTEEEIKAGINIINPPAFRNKELNDYMINKIKEMGINVIEDVKIHSFEADDEKKQEDEKNSLDRVVLEKIHVNEVEDDEQKQSKTISGEEEEEEGEADNLIKIPCKVCITAGHRDVDVDVFNAIHDNSLVYNGRLIVDKIFQTADVAIFGGGSLCAFSGQFKTFLQGHSSRMEYYNSREVGMKLARAFFDLLDPITKNIKGENPTPEDVPVFTLPFGHGGMVPGNLHYYFISLPHDSLSVKQNENLTRKDLISDTLKLGAKGHYLRFTFNNIGIINSATYLGNEDISVQSLWSFVGLHETYLNQLVERYEKKIIPDAAEFLSENWAIALYHDWFMEFIGKLRSDLQKREDIEKITKYVQETFTKGISKDDVTKLRGMMSTSTKTFIEENVINFIRAQITHLPMYYVPKGEFE